MADQPVIGWINDAGLSVFKAGEAVKNGVASGIDSVLNVGKSLVGRSGEAAESTKTPFTATMYFLGALIPLVVILFLIYFLCFYDGLCCSGRSLFGMGDGTKAALKGKSGKEKSAGGKSSAPTADGSSKTATFTTNAV